MTLVDTTAHVTDINHSEIMKLVDIGANLTHQSFAEDPDEVIAASVAADMKVRTVQAIA